MKRSQRLFFIFIIYFLFIPGSLSENESTNLSILEYEMHFTPDLSVSDLQYPQTVKTGEDVTGSIIVSNNGPVSATNIVSDFILKKETDQGDKIIWLGSKSTELMPPGQRGKIPFGFSIPKGLTEGEYHLEVIIQAYEQEIFNQNNRIQTSTPIKIIQGEKWKWGHPNLQIAIDSIDTNMTSPGSPLRISYSIINQNKDTSGSFQTAFILSPDMNLSSGGYRIREERVFSVLSYMNEKGSSVDLIPEFVPPGVYYLISVVDYTGMIQETDETDNIFIYSDPVSITYPDDIYSDSYADSISGYLYLKTNKYREYLGLRPLEFDDDLRKIAFDHSLDMIERSYFSHYTPEGIDPAGRAQLAGYDINRKMDDGSIRTGIAENIIRIASGHTIGKAYTGFVDPTTPEEIADVMMIEWINSPEHNKNLINPTIEKVGIGAKFDGEFFYATQNFF
ncbi:MAG: hypothetical protein GXY18_04250 [Methanomicrobiales archaeon]|nr:hypothetical protein [Methanomicrobiales archaeon]